MDQLSKMQLTEQQLKHWFVSLAEVEMSWGSGFGAAGDGFSALILLHLVQY